MMGGRLIGCSIKISIPSSCTKQKTFFLILYTYPFICWYRQMWIWLLAKHFSKKQNGYWQNMVINIVTFQPLAMIIIDWVYIYLLLH